MIRFLHAADIHLDSQLRGLEDYEGAPVATIRQATRGALIALVDLAIEREVHFVLIAGDLYDGDWKDFNTGLFFVSQLVRLRNAGIRTYVIRGNHDAANRMTQSLHVSANPDGTKVLFSHECAETVLLEDLRVAIHGQSFERPAEFRNLVDEYPAPVAGYVNIGLLHTSLNGAEGHEPYAPCTPEQLRTKGYDYWALGHVHERAIVEGNIVFAGNPQGRHIRETGARGCYIVELDEGQAKAEFVAVDVFRWFVADVRLEDSVRNVDVLDAVRAELMRLTDLAEGRPFAVRLIVSGETELNDDLHARLQHWRQQFRALALEIGAGSIWLEKVKLATHPLAEKVSDDDGPIAELRNIAQAMQNSDVLVGEFLSELKPLMRRLPDSIVDADDLGLSESALVNEALKDALPMLIHALNASEKERVANAN